VSLHGFFINLDSTDRILKDILGIETFVQFVETFTYIWIIRTRGCAAGLKEQLCAAEAKAVRLERELFGANAKILEEQQERLTVMRAQASSAAQAAIQQSKQFDRGKLDVRVNS
jgi:hypothetical protein